MPTSRIAMLAPLAVVLWVAWRGCEVTPTRVRTPRPARTERVARLVDWVRASSVVAPATDAGPPLDAPPGAPAVAVAEPLTWNGLVVDAVVAAICPTAVRAICGARARLGCVAPFDDDDGEPRPCPEDVRERCGRWAMITYGGAADLLVVQPDRVERCLEAIAAEVEAPSSSRVDDLCGELAVEPVVPGEACATSAACVGGHCIEGTCVADGALGEPCEWWCTPDLECVAGLCEAPVPRGGACDEESVCERPTDVCLDGRCDGPRPGECLWDDDCASGEHCRDGACEPGASTCFLGDECGLDRACVGEAETRCVAPIGVGWLCGPTLCPPGLSCIDGACAAPEPSPGHAGVSCLDDADCGPGLACGAVIPEGRCRPAVCADAHVFSGRSHFEDCH